MNIVLKTLLARYWALIVTENIGSTPEITAELDELEREIRKWP